MSFYLLLLAATIALELPVAHAVAPRERRRSVVATAILTNLLTHPIATALHWSGQPFLLLEPLVILVECACYHFAAGVSENRALAIACCANAVTIAAAWMLTGLA